MCTASTRPRWWLLFCRFHAASAVGSTGPTRGWFSCSSFGFMASSLPPDTSMILLRSHMPNVVTSGAAFTLGIIALHIALMLMAYECTVACSEPRAPKPTAALGTGKVPGLPPFHPFPPLNAAFAQWAH